MAVTVILPHIFHIRGRTGYQSNLDVIIPLVIGIVGIQGLHGNLKPVLIPLVIDVTAGQGNDMVVVPSGFAVWVVPALPQ